MQTSPSYLSISLEVIVSGRALTPRSIVVRTIYTAEGRPTFCIYKSNLTITSAIRRSTFRKHTLNEEAQATETKGMLSPGIHLCSNDFLALRSFIARRTQNDCLLKPNRCKLFQEGDPFLGSGNSGKPILLCNLEIRSKGLPQDQFGSVNGATRLHDA